MLLLVSSSVLLFEWVKSSHHAPFSGLLTRYIVLYLLGLVSGSRNYERGIASKVILSVGHCESVLLFCTHRPSHSSSILGALYHLVDIPLLYD